MGVSGTLDPENLNNDIDGGGWWHRVIWLFIHRGDGANGHVLMEQGCCVFACEEHAHPHVTCFVRGTNVGLAKRVVRAGLVFFSLISHMMLVFFLNNIVKKKVYIFFLLFFIL